MDLQPGCRLAVAPHFHLAVAWAERLRLGCIEADQGRFLPGNAWRAPTPDEQQRLVADGGADAAADDLCIFALPQHLQSAFWTMLEHEPAPLAGMTGFGPFAHEVATFLDFKGLPVPSGAVFDLVVGKPGQRSIQWDADRALPIGLTFNAASWVAWPPEDEQRAPRLWGGLNVGDEAVAILFINQTAGELAAALARAQPHEPPPPTFGALACRFLTQFPDHSVVRFQLAPGEGYRVPRGGLLIDVCTLDMQGPAIMLMVRHACDAETDNRDSTAS